MAFSSLPELWQRSNVVICCGCWPNLILRMPSLLRLLVPLDPTTNTIACSLSTSLHSFICLPRTAVSSNYCHRRSQTPSTCSRPYRQPSSPGSTPTAFYSEGPRSALDVSDPHVAPTLHRIEPQHGVRSYFAPSSSSSSSASSCYHYSTHSSPSTTPPPPSNAAAALQQATSIMCGSTCPETHSHS